MDTYIRVHIYTYVYIHVSICISTYVYLCVHNFFHLYNFVFTDAPTQPAVLLSQARRAAAFAASVAVAGHECHPNRGSARIHVGAM